MPDVKPRILDDSDKSKVWKLTEINEPSQIHSLRLPDTLLAVRVCTHCFTRCVEVGALKCLSFILSSME